MLDQVHALLVEVLAVPDADETAHQILSWLLGTIVQQHVRPRSPDVLRRELATITSASPGMIGSSRTRRPGT